jgi:hypothetical protein
MNGCTHLDATNAKLAESAMSLLTEDCTSVPGGTASFSAILNPNGRIELATPPGQPEVIPVCVVKRPLTHRVRLQKACKLDVRLEQTSIALPSLDAGAADH